MSPDIEYKLASEGNVYLIAPAGYGKTELIAKAVALQDQGRVLLLTHTHAGVRSMRERLKRLGVSSRQYSIETIASWALNLAASYPGLSGITNNRPMQDEWKYIYNFARNVLQHRNIKSMINKSYAGVFIDEYQDCTKNQHEVVMTLADFLPVRILGDPLQGIFGFDDDPLVDWETDIFPYFKNLGQLQEPWRWKNNNPKLGNWLKEVRQSLLTGEEIDVQNAPKGSVSWIRNDQNAGRNACFGASRLQGSIVAIQKWANQAHLLASQLRGLYTSMEEIECKDLLKWAEDLDQADAINRCLIIIDGAGKCWTGLNGELRNIRNAIKEGRIPKSQKYPQVVDVFEKVIETPNDPIFLLIALRKCQSAGNILFRKELWQEMQRVMEVFQLGEFDNFKDTAWHIRNQARQQGRKLSSHIVSRTLLIKGLEFDHVIVVNADDLDDPKNLYVALTRCKKSLKILSSNPIMKRSLP